MNKLRLMEILARVPLFKDLQPGERESVIRMKAAFTPMRSRETFIKEGAQEPWFYIILAGKAEVSIKDHIIGELSPGQFIGEVGFICREPRSATVTSVTEMVVMKIDYEAFKHLPIRVREAIKDKVISGLSERVIRLNDSFVKQEDEIEQLKLRIGELEAEINHARPGMKGR